jgi:hypothetical protein
MSSSTQKTGQTVPLNSGYWKHYGGLLGLVKSPYFWVALVLTPFLDGLASTKDWTDTCISILPSTAGFSLGAYAIFLAVGNEGYIRSAAEFKTKNTTLYFRFTSTFTHFIIVQAIGLIFALIGKSAYQGSAHLEWLASFLTPYQLCLAKQFLPFFGVFFLMYAALLLVGAAKSLFGLGKTYAGFLLSRPDQAS